MPDLALERMVKSMLTDLEVMRTDSSVHIYEWYNLWYHYDKIKTAIERREEGRSEDPDEEESFRIQGQLY